MPTNSSPKTSKILRDAYFFVWFRSLVVACVYVITLLNSPDTRQLEVLIPFTLLVIVEIVLQWVILKFVTHPTKILWFIIIQGLLVFMILGYARNLLMVLSLYMILIGDSIGLFKLTPRGLFSCIFYLALMFGSLVQLSGWDSASSLFIGWLPIVIIIILSVAFYMRQNEAREQAQALASDLEIANQQLAEYAANVEDLTIVNERQRMARELHDTLTQGVAGLILKLDAADANLSKNNNEKARSIVGNAMKDARSILVDARRAIEDLRQPSLENLDSTLQLEISDFTKLTGIPVSFHKDQIPQLSEVVIDTLIRSISEALTNIARHANAQNVDLNIFTRNETLFVSIKDDGIGFDENTIPPGHYGLIGIKERAAQLNGKFSIQSDIGNGTCLVLELPL